MKPISMKAGTTSHANIPSHSSLSNSLESFIAVTLLLYFDDVERNLITGFKLFAVGTGYIMWNN